MNKTSLLNVANFVEKYQSTIGGPFIYGEDDSSLSHIDEMMDALGLKP